MRTKQQYQSLQQKQGNTAVPGQSRARRPEAPTRLKAERVQLRVRPVSGEQEPGAAGERLKELPGWQLARNGKAIAMVREFADSLTAMDYAGILLQLAVQSGQRVGIELAGARVKVSLRSRSRGSPPAGLAEEALEFARSLC